MMGCGRVVKARDFDSRFRRFESCHPFHLQKAYNMKKVINFFKTAKIIIYDDLKYKFKTIFSSNPCKIV